MELTQNTMRAAHFAQQLDLDPNYTITGEDRARAWSRKMHDTDPGSNAEEDTVDKYLIGKVILSRYTLTYSHRFNYSLSPLTLAPDVVGNITVDAGHLAGNEMRRLAVFRKRE